MSAPPRVEPSRELGHERGARENGSGARTAVLYISLMPTNYAARIIKGKLMPTWLRSLVNAFLGKVPGKPRRPDTATRMMIDADFSLRRELPRETPPTVIRTPVNKSSLKDQK
jgi:hypothetical protein